MTDAPLALLGFVAGREIRYPLTPGRHRVGRSEENELRLEDRSVSRQHAVIEVGSGGLKLQDLGSYNGTRINGARVEGSAPLHAGDQVSFAHVLFRLADPAADITTGPAAERAAAGDTGPLSRLSDETMIRQSDQISWRDLRATGAGARDEQTRLFQVLAGAGELLAAQRDLDDICEPILDLVEQAFGPERTFILLREEEEAEPVIRASRLKGRRSQDRMVLSRTLMNRVLEERAAFLVDDALSDPDLAARQSIIMQGVRSAMAVPLVDREEVLGLLYADSSDPHRFYSTDELRAFTLLANVIAVAITNARFRALEAEKQRLDLEVGAAREILQQILPAELPACEGWQLVAHQEPCSEVGGDLYDARLLPDGRLVVLLGDVTGHGLGAALLVSHIMSVVGLLVDEGWDAERLVPKLNVRIFRATDAVRFATFFFGILDPAAGRLSYVNAGHNPPLLIAADGTVQRLPAGGLPLGMFEEATYTAGAAHIAPGSLLLIYSDGIPEAIDTSETEYGEARLEQLIVRERARSAAEISARLLEDLSGFCGEAPAADDVTLLLLRRA